MSSNRNDYTASMRERSLRDSTLPTRAELERLFVQKYGSPETTGWAPRRRIKAGYFPPADVYECFVSKQITDGCTWLDVGGGHAIFPQNPRLAETLVSRCRTVVAIDPSENVHQNPFDHEKVQDNLEAYDPGFQFDLATMRMVVEHVEYPEAFVSALSRLVRPGGAALVFTVNRWSAVALLSRLLPFRMHHPIKERFWGGDEADTFPVHYRMNTRSTLRRLFTEAGFVEEVFATLDDLSVFARFSAMNRVELGVRSMLNACGLRYPEHCLLALYRNAAK